MSRHRTKVCARRAEVLAWLATSPPRFGEELELTENLTERQTRILDYIRSVTKTRNYPPSVREIGEAVGLSSISTVGNVAAGSPILAEQNIEDHVLLSSELAKEGYFLLRVRGDSMVNAGIFDGDLVLVRPQHEATNGSIVVALVDGDATVKRFERSNGHVKLIAENPAYEPIVTTSVSLVGVVRGVIRLFR